MIIKRTKNAKRNIKVGILRTVIDTVLPFLCRTAVIYVLGAEYLGLSSMFNALLQMLNLTELGFGSAIVYAMYKPIAEDDDSQICALLNLFRRIYRIVGIVILCIGVCLLPFIRYFVKGDTPAHINIHYVYLVYLINTTLSYWALAYKSVIPLAFQRGDLVSIGYAVSDLFQIAVQVAVLILTRNYYYFIIVLPFATLLHNLIVSFVVDRYYPQYQCEGTVSAGCIAEIKKRVSGLLVQNICYTTRNSMDSICISAFLGLALTAMYNNYFCIIYALGKFCGVIGSAITAGIGNSIAIDGVEHNYRILQKLDFLYMWIAGWSGVCLLCLFQPFMELWMGQELLLPFGVVVCFVLYYYILRMGEMCSVFNNAAGLWWENRIRAMTEAVINIVLNMILVHVWGIYGIIWGTLVPLFFVSQIYGSSIIFRFYFRNKKYGRYLLSHLKYFLTFVLACAITLTACSAFKSDNIRVLIVRSILCIILPNLVFYIIYRRTDIYRESIQWLSDKLRSNNDQD